MKASVVMQMKSAVGVLMDLVVSIIIVTHLAEMRLQIRQLVVKIMKMIINVMNADLK
jgi:hypothetical protein